MTETCDRCGPAVRAMYRADRNGELYLCRHCASQLWRALSTQGWTVWPISAQASGPHTSQQRLPRYAGSIGPEPSSRL